MGERIVARLLALALLFLCLPSPIHAATCFGAGGSSYNNQVQCTNSDVCCTSQSACMPNKLCADAGPATGQTFVRGACTQNPYSLDTCSPLCLYNETTLGGQLPLVNLCGDGSYCCNADEGCCEAKRGMYIDSTGKIISASAAAAAKAASNTQAAPTSTQAQAGSTQGSEVAVVTVQTTSNQQLSSTTAAPKPSSTTSNGSPADPAILAASSSAQLSASSRASASAARMTSTVSSLADTAPTQTPSAGLSTAAKIGLGVGIPVVVLGGTLAAMLLWRHKKRDNMLSLDEDAPLTKIGPMDSISASSRDFGMSKAPSFSVNSVTKATPNSTPPHGPNSFRQPTVPQIGARAQNFQAGNQAAGSHDQPMVFTGTQIGDRMTQRFELPSTELVDNKPRLPGTVWSTTSGSPQFQTRKSRNIFGSKGPAELP